MAYNKVRTQNAVLTLPYRGLKHNTHQGTCNVLVLVLPYPIGDSKTNSKKRPQLFTPGLFGYMENGAKKDLSDRHSCVVTGQVFMHYEL